VWVPPVLLGLFSSLPVFRRQGPLQVDLIRRGVTAAAGLPSVRQCVAATEAAAFAAAVCLVEMRIP